LKPRTAILVLALVVISALLTAPFASAKSPIRVAVADQSPAMFAAAPWRALAMKRTRYFVPANVMQNTAERAKARAFVIAARASGVSTLLHISTSDLRSKRGPLVSTAAYKANVSRIVTYFRLLGVKDFGAWNEVNHKTQETWNHVGSAVSYFKSMWTTVHGRCPTCGIVGLDVLDQAGVDKYMRSFYSRLSATWRTRLKVVGIHNYSDVNRNRSTGTAKIIRTARMYNRATKFWFTETGALAGFGRSFPYDLTRQASRIRNMFTYATRYRTVGVERVYSYNYFGAHSTSCGTACSFDAGLVNPDGSLRPVYSVFKAKAANFSR
jgi:hypothetical protein